MSKRRRVKEKKIEQYEHREVKRLNNPPVGLVTSELDPTNEIIEYVFDAHIDPQLMWAGKAEHMSFHVDTVSLHVHERIDPKTIIQAVRQSSVRQQELLSFFTSPNQTLSLRDAIEFYRHSYGWSNRLIAGDSLLVMNSLLEKEGMSGKVQMIYLDPPYGIKYSSNFQPFVNKRNVKDRKDEDLTQEPEMIKAYRDTWEMGIHSYLTYLRDRLLLARDLISDKGHIFVQINDENLHHVREILDEIFGAENRISQISFLRGGAQTSKALPSVSDFLLWYAKDKKKAKFSELLLDDGGWAARSRDMWVEEKTGKRRRLKKGENLPDGAIPFTHRSLESATGSEASKYPIEFEGKIFTPRRGWSTNKIGIERLREARRLLVIGNTLRFVVYLTDYPFSRLTNNWTDTIESGFASNKVYVVQTAPKIVQRCILMTTDPGDLVFDPTCGSGTTAYCSEQWGRRWITCDTSRVALTLTKQRLMTALFDYYKLMSQEHGVSGGFMYKSHLQITLKSIVRDESPNKTTLIDQPHVDSSKVRVTGPFTVEAVPAPFVKSISEVVTKGFAEKSVAREGETLRQSEWRAELLKTGIRGRNGQKIDFIRVEALSGTRWIHADAETKEDEPKRVVITFGPEYSPLDQTQVELTIEEAQRLVPRPKLIVFASFQFDPEAAKDIDETIWPGVTLLKAQMNADLLTEDLKKKRASNESFWLVGQPDVQIFEREQGKYQVEVHGFDYYNPITGVIESGGTEKIAMWMLDTNYDYRSLFPRQVFFPMSGNREGWSRLARNLKSDINEDMIEKYRGTTSLPFSLGENKSVAVKIIDDRGIESLKIIKVG